MTISVDGIKYEAGDFSFDEEVAYIDAWWDRHTRDYCIQKMNREGFQVGDAIRVGNRHDRDAVVRDLIIEYGL